MPALVDRRRRALDRRSAASTEGLVGDVELDGPEVAGLVGQRRRGGRAVAGLDLAHAGVHGVAARASARTVSAPKPLDAPVTKMFI